MSEHKKAILRLVRENSNRFRTWEIWRDFCELAALAMSNAVDRSHFSEREARYLEIVGRYNADEVARFPKMLGALTLELEAGLADTLGELFMELELGNHWKGQYFTPFAVCSLMARMQLSDHDWRERINERGFVRMMEPCVGAGAMVIAFVQAMRDAGGNPQRELHVSAVDVDITAVHMSYVQLSLLHIPAVICHGDSLSMEMWSQWRTPAHILGRWDRKLRPVEGEAVTEVLGEIAEEAATAAEAEAPLPASIQPAAAGQLILF